MRPGGPRRTTPGEIARRSVVAAATTVSVAEALAEAVAATLGVPVVAAQFYEPGVGGVVGLDLADGRAVVAEVHRATFVPRERLAAAQVGSSGQPVKVGSAVTGLAAGATGTMSWPSSCASPWSWPLPWSWSPSSPWSWPS